MITKVVNLYKEPYDVYIGRNGKGNVSIWGNPFIAGKDGTSPEVIQKYEQYIRTKLATGTITNSQLMQLKGKRLGCFCKPKPCHGDILVKLIESGEYQ